MDSFHLFVAIGKRQNGHREPLPWALIVCPSMEPERGTFYSPAGSQSDGYILKTSRDRKVDLKRFEDVVWVGSIEKEDVEKLEIVTWAVKPVFGQRWVVDVMFWLERQGIVRQGTRDEWFAKMEHHLLSEDGTRFRYA